MGKYEEVARATRVLSRPIEKPAANLSRLSGTSLAGMNKSSTTDLIRNKFRKGKPTMPPTKVAAPKQTVRPQPKPANKTTAMSVRKLRRTGAAVLAGTAVASGAVGYAAGKRKRNY